MAELAMRMPWRRRQRLDVATADGAADEKDGDADGGVPDDPDDGDRPRDDRRAVALSLLLVLPLLPLRLPLRVLYSGAPVTFRWLKRLA